RRRNPALYRLPKEQIAMKTRHSPVLKFGIAVVLALLIGSGFISAQQRGAAANWVTAWATTQANASNSAITNATVRMITRVTIGGDAARIRLDNTFGEAPVTIGKTMVGARLSGADLVAGTNHPVVFNGQSSVTIPVGGSVTSDPVNMKVMALEELAVSLYVPGSDVKASQHAGAQVTSFLSAG